MSTIPVVAMSETEFAPHVTSRTAELRALRYFAVAFVVGALIYVAPLFAFRLGIGTRQLLSFWGSVVEASYHDQHQDADIVIFGDSTAATNIDPLRMTRDLHMKVLVLPNVSTSLSVSGYGPLEGYLRTNKPPRLIVFYLSDWGLDFMHNPLTQIVEEGEEMLLLHGSRSEVVAYARKNPRKALMFPLHFYASTNSIGDLLYLRQHFVPKLDQGHILSLPDSMPMTPDCAFNLGHIMNNGADSSVREGVYRFTNPHTQTLVLASAVPRCIHLDLLLKAQHPGLGMPPLQVLAPSNFREDGWQAHMLPSAIGLSTNYLELTIRKKLAEPGVPGSTH